MLFIILTKVEPPNRYQTHFPENRVFLKALFVPNGEVFLVYIPIEPEMEPIVEPKPSDLLGTFHELIE